jgi:hypothetical protein
VQEEHRALRLASRRQEPGKQRRPVFRHDLERLVLDAEAVGRVDEQAVRLEENLGATREQQAYEQSGRKSQTTDPV